VLHSVVVGVNIRDRACLESLPGGIPLARSAVLDPELIVGQQIGD
jgi:hypothetical protein